MTLQYETITPAGALFTEQCVATGHAHTNPDVPLRQTCPTHHEMWVWCGECGQIWCPGFPGRNNPHMGSISTAAPLPADVAEVV